WLGPMSRRGLRCHTRDNISCAACSKARQAQRSGRPGARPLTAFPDTGRRRTGRFGEPAVNADVVEVVIFVAIPPEQPLSGVDEDVVTAGRRVQEVRIVG